MIVRASLAGWIEPGVVFSGVEISAPGSGHAGERPPNGGQVIRKNA